MVVELTGNEEQRRWREAMAFVYRDAPDRMPKELPSVQYLDPARLHAFHDALKRKADELTGGIRRAAESYNPTRKTVGMLYIPAALRQAMGIKYEFLVDETLAPDDLKTNSLRRHEVTHWRQDIEGRWDTLGHEGRELGAEDTERAYYETTRPSPRRSPGAQILVRRN